MFYLFILNLIEGAILQIQNTSGKLQNYYKAAYNTRNRAKEMMNI